MLIRKLGGKKGYSIVFCTKNGKTLAKILIEKLSFWNNGIDKNNAIFLENRHGSKVYLHKNITHYVVEYIAKEKSRCEVFADIIENRLNINEEELKDLAFEQMLSKKKEYADTWIHSDLFGDSMLQLAEIIYPIAEKEINKIKNNYHYLRNMETHDIIMKLFDKWVDNQNHFSGNMKMLYTLIQISVVNLMNTLHTKYKDKAEKTVSIDDMCGENITYGETLQARDMSNEIINKIMLSNLTEKEKRVVVKLYYGYKIEEICKSLNINPLELKTIIDNIVASKVLY